MLRVLRRDVVSACGAVLLLGLAGAPALASGWMERALASQKAQEPAAKAAPKASAAPVAKSPTKAATAPAAPTAVQISQAMQTAANDVGNLDTCAQSGAGKTFNQCVADRLDKLANALEKSPAAKPASPKTIQIVREAAKAVRVAKTKEEAVTALQKAAAVLSGAIATANQTSTSGYGPKAGVEGVAGALNKAIAAVQKGA